MIDKTNVLSFLLQVSAIREDFNNLLAALPEGTMAGTATSSPSRQTPVSGWSRVCGAMVYRGIRTHGHKLISQREVKLSRIKAIIREELHHFRYLCTVVSNESIGFRKEHLLRML